MAVRKLAGYAAIGLAVGLITGWVVSIAVSSLAQTTGAAAGGVVRDLTFANACHTSAQVGPSTGMAFDNRNSDQVIWQGTKDGLCALITVKCTEGSTSSMGGVVTVKWTNQDNREVEQPLGVGQSTTVFATKVWIEGTTDTGKGAYWITVNIAR